MSGLLVIRIKAECVSHDPGNCANPDPVSSAPEEADRCCTLAKAAVMLESPLENGMSNAFVQAPDMIVFDIWIAGQANTL